MSGIPVTIGIRYGVKGVGQRAFYPWVKDNYSHLFPQIAGTHPPVPPPAYSTILDGRFLAEPTLMGIADSYGTELCHPIRDGRRARHIGRKGISNHSLWC